jgi:diguanylate cyclase (GGDEF)-like protein/PAS domain S-box-containing protein
MSNSGSDIDQRIQELETQVRQLGNELLLTKEENEYATARYLDLYCNLGKKIKERTLELELLHRQQKRILNAIGEGIFGLDSQNRVTFVNPAALTMLGYEQHELLGSTLHETIHLHRQDGELYPCEECPICACCKGGPLLKGTETFWRKNGASFPVRYTATPIHEDYENLGAVVAFADISEDRKMEEKLRESALTDELTGLYNRRGFMTLADQLIKRSARDKTDLLLIYVDLDKMKWINDTLGHSVGDQALVETAILLRDTFRLADVVGRIGGDEFVILCTDNSALGNEEIILGRLSKTVKKTNRITNRQYQLSLSVGVGRYEHLAPCSIDDLLRRADLAMYKNKTFKKAHQQDGYNQSWSGKTGQGFKRKISAPIC